MNDSGKVLGVIRVDADYSGIKAVCDRAGHHRGQRPAAFG